MMSGIRARNTKPEIVVRSLLFKLGFRFRLHRKDLPGKPDIVLPRYRIAIFVHGCFWHQHTGCRLAKFPNSNVEFWEAKLRSNIERDRKNCNSLVAAGWRVLIVWECATKSEAARLALENAITSWIDSDTQVGELPVAQV